MRVVTPSTNKGNWYDRALSQGNTYGSGGATAPVYPTQVFYYTVPTGRLCTLGAASVSMERLSAATTPDYYNGYISVGLPSLSTVKMVNISSNSNTPHDVKWAGVDLNVTLPAGAVVTASFQDRSTGGLIEYYLGVVTGEFDA